MARRRRDSLPPPPGRDGGYEFEVVVPGPPAYFSPPPAVAARGGLVPAGDGEGHPVRPAPPDRRPTWRPDSAAPSDPAGPTDDAALHFAANFHLGLARSALTDHPSAVARLERALAVARRAGDPRMAALALDALGTVFREVGRAADAVPLTAEAVRFAEASADRRLLSRVLVSYGSLLRHLGRYEEAAAVLERALATAGEFEP